MKKIALSLTAASMIFAGLAGCGNVNDTGMNDTTTGYTANQGQRAGTTTGWFDNNQNQTLFGGDRQTGMNRNRGNDFGAYDGVNDRGFGAQRGRGFGARENTINQSTRNQNVGQGAGLVGEERNFGSAFDYQRGNTTPHDNFRGQNRGRNVTGLGRGNRDHRGFGRGITGNDRPGMVDENGILNRFGTGNTRGQTALNRGTRGLNRGTTNNLNRGTTGFNNRGATDELNRGEYNRGISENLTRGAEGFNRGTTTHTDGLYRGTRGLNRNNNGMTGQRTGAYFDTDDGRLATRINDSIRNDDIRDSRVIVNGDNVIVGVEGNNNRNVAEGLRNRVRGLAGNRNVHIVTDSGQVRSLRDMDDRLRAGDAFDEVGATFNDMINDLGNAARRPFERSRR